MLIVQNQKGRKGKESPHGGADRVAPEEEEGDHILDQGRGLGQE